MSTLDDLRYPVGRFHFDDSPAVERGKYINEIEELPQQLRGVVAGLTEEQWETPYRPEGWSVRQVVHHLPDSHLNAYVRFKLALTEEQPTIKPYNEAAWARLADTERTPPEVSLHLLEALHERWVELLRAMREEDFGRTLLHPEQGRVQTLDSMLQLYAWHGRHHVGHIEALRSRMGW